MATEPRSKLARLLAEVTPGDISMTFFTNGGAEANENAIKLARWYTGTHKIIARYRSYHGATAGAITLTGDPRRWAAEPGIPGVVRMFDPYTYRCPAGHPDPCPVCTGAPHLEEILQYEGAHTVAAVILETVTGTNGIIVPPDGYLQSIRETCDRHGILLIADEVMAGFGRTGKWFAVDNWDVVPDIITMAKGINSGYVPLGAMSIREPIAAWVRDKYFAGGLTYSGHPLACAVGRRVDRGVPRRRHRRARRRSGPHLRRGVARPRSQASVDRRCARPRLLLGPRARQVARDARAARSVQRLRRGGRAGDAPREGGARARALPHDALERGHDLPAAHDHARGARRGHRDPRRRPLDRRRVLRGLTKSYGGRLSRSQLEALEAAGYEPRSGELLVALVWLVLGELPIAADELNASRRRAMFVLAAGGDPHRELDLNTVAAERLAAELDSPERRQALHDALGALEAEGLPAVQDGLSALQADAELAWRCLGLALLADELADE